MQNTFYVSLSRQVALQREMDVIANNMANMTTTGFKGSRPLFADYLAGTGETVSVAPKSRGKVAYVEVIGVQRDTSQGTLQATGNATDVALQGDGFFVVETDKGPRYTRNGHFGINADGNLATVDGQALLGEGDRPISIPRTGGTPTIGADGSVTVDGATAGRLRVVEFTNLQALVAEGGSLYSSPAGNDPSPATATKVAQGMIESSNIQPIAEMTRMIEVSRSYQSLQSIITAQNDLERSAIQTLGKVA